ncbi:caspase domain-containing protein [Embleya sp. NPDC059237]|uniref:caspase family protein n=1 Tax=Embleya sp. NPDC059237 TaxID=3346784 RepID=UPI00367E66AB
MPPGSDRIDRSGSRAVLIGVPRYRDPDFPDVPAAGNSLRAMRRMLVDEELGGWPDGQVFVLPPIDCRRVMSSLRLHAQNTTGVLLLYFVGHGTVTPNGDLVLAVSDTLADQPDVTGLEYSKVRSVLRDSPARVTAVVLDCCYSGRVIDVLAGEQGHLADITDVRGAYTLTAADRAAHAGQANTRTPFTGELLDLIGTGIAGGPPVLTFAELYPHLRHRLIARNLPQPNQRGTDTADKCPVAKNTAAEPPTPAPRPRASDHATRVTRPEPHGAPDEQPKTPPARGGIRRRTVVSAATAPTRPAIDDERKRRSRRSWVIPAVIALSCILLGGVLAVVLNTSFGAPGRGAGSPNNSPAATSSGPLRSGGGESVRPTSTSPSPSIRSWDKKFEEVNVGDCFDTIYDLLDGYALDGDGRGPEVVPCTSSRAYYKVTDIHRPSTYGVCPKTSDGRGEWPNSGPGRSNVTLCVDRFFQAGQCFLGKGDDKPTGSYVVKGRGCSVLLNLDKPNNFLLQIIAVKPGSSTVSDCPKQYPGQEIYSTRALDDTQLLCLKVAIHGA